MRTRIRIGPFTFGRGGLRLSPWRGGTGFSIPLFNGKARSYGKVKIWIFSFYFSSNNKKRDRKKALPENVNKIKRFNKQAYEPWTIKSDKKLIALYNQGKSTKELSEIFGRTNGAIRSRLKKLL